MSCNNRRMTQDLNKIPKEKNSLANRRREARAKVRDFLKQEANDCRLAEELTQIVHGPICMYEASLRRLKVRRTESGFILKTLRSSNAAIPSLERLLQHSAEGGYLWEKAWAEKTVAAWDLIVAVAPPGFSVQIGATPAPGQIQPLLDEAIRLARKPRLTKERRDRAVIEILRVYRKLYGRPPPSPKGPRSATSVFIGKTEEAYQDLLPKGFGVSKSKGTLDRLIKLSVASEAL